MSIRVAMDTETTGIDRGSRLLSLAGILFDDETGQVLDRREWTVNPGMPIPPDAAKVNGFTDEAVKDAPDAGTVLREFFGWLPAPAVLVAHHAQYDTGILTWEAGRFGLAIPNMLTVICTCETAKALKATKRNSLDALVEHYVIQRCGEGHRAMSDAEACKDVYLEQIKVASTTRVPWDVAGHDYRYTDRFPEHLANLPALVAAGAPLTFCYEDKDGAQSERSVIPYGWHELKSETYFHGFCLLRKERRTFHTERVLSVIPEAA